MAAPKKLEVTALLGLVLQGAFVLTCFWLERVSGSRAVEAEMWYLMPGLLVWLLVLVHGRQRRLALQESEERERLKETRLSTEIFEETELDTMRASAGLLIFERYFVPVLSVILSGGLLFLVYRLVTGFWGQTWTVTRPSAVAMGMVLMSFLGYLIGKYAAGLAQNRGFRLLRAAGGYILGNVVAAILIAIAMAMYYFDIKWGETLVTYVIPLIMALVALEILLNLLLDIYRPRVPGQETRPPYDSRLLGLFAEPQGVFHTLAATLDYQFGFKVSETWFYRFMQRAIIPLVLIQFVSLWLLTVFVVVNQDEIVFIEHLGKPYVSGADKAKGIRATAFGPGFYLKAPWPISTARHVPAYRVLSFEVGKVLKDSASAQTHVIPMDVILWRETHIDPKVGFEASFLVPSTAAGRETEGSVPASRPSAPASRPSAPPSELPREGTEAQAGEEGTPGDAELQEPADASAGKRKAPAPRVNLVRLDAWVYYRVKRRPDGQIDENAAFSYIYRQTDIQQHLEKLAYRAVCRIAASQDFLKWVAEERGKTTGEFKRLLSEAVDQEDLGVEVVDATFSAVHPPSEVAGAYEAVVGALQDREGTIYQGEQEAVRMEQGAEASAAELLRGAEGYAYRQKITAQGDADQFLVQHEAYRQAPRVYAFRAYFDTIEQALPGHKVYIVPAAPHEVQVIDLQERLRTQLLEDLDVMEGQPK